MTLTAFDRPDFDEHYVNATAGGTRVALGVDVVTARTPAGTLCVRAGDFAVPVYGASSPGTRAMLARDSAGSRRPVGLLTPTGEANTVWSEDWSHAGVMLAPYGRTLKLTLRYSWQRDDGEWSTLPSSTIERWFGSPSISVRTFLPPTNSSHMLARSGNGGALFLTRRVDEVVVGGVGGGFWTQGNIAASVASGASNSAKIPGYLSVPTAGGSPGLYNSGVHLPQSAYRQSTLTATQLTRLEDGTAGWSITTTIGNCLVAQAVGQSGWGGSSSWDGSYDPWDLVYDRTHPDSDVQDPEGLGYMSSGFLGLLFESRKALYLPGYASWAAGVSGEFGSYHPGGYGYASETGYAFPNEIMDASGVSYVQSSSSWPIGWAADWFFANVPGGVATYPGTQPLNAAWPLILAVVTVSWQSTSWQLPVIVFC